MLDVGQQSFALKVLTLQFGQLCKAVPRFPAGFASATFLITEAWTREPKQPPHCYCCRWDKGYENCRLSEVPHVRLTAPAKVFGFCLDGASKPRGRDNLLKLQVERAGRLNAIAFWFDLQLDDTCTITSGLLSHIDLFLWVSAEVEESPRNWSGNTW